jgi:hypothetical protein
MSITPQSIHKPLSDFFLKKFSTAAGSSVFFRFDKFGSVVSDEDFVDPTRPERGYVPAIATEKFSDLVNRIPVDQDDGVNILLSAASIDELYYYRLLNPSVPYLAAGASEQTKEAVMNAFNRTKADALKVWNNARLESAQGMDQFLPARATPANWYDRTKNDVWTRHSLTVSEPAPKPGPPPPIFRLKLSDESVRSVLHLQGKEAVTSANLTKALTAAKTTVRPGLAVAATARPAVARDAVAPGIANLALAKNVTAATALSNATLHNQLMVQSRTLAIKDRVVMTQFVGKIAPTKPVVTNSISISFEYCKTDIHRPWYINAFVNDPSWYLPGVPKGQLGSEDTGGMSLLPIGFVAIRNLAIHASWTQEDVASAKLSDGFGPFRVAFDNAKQSLVHAGVQIFGWVLQKMPVVPPNEPQ